MSPSQLARLQEGMAGQCCAGEGFGPPDDDCRTQCMDFRLCADYAGDGLACCSSRPTSTVVSTGSASR